MHCAQPPTHVIHYCDWWRVQLQGCQLIDSLQPVNGWADCVDIGYAINDSSGATSSLVVITDAFLSTCARVLPVSLFAKLLLTRVCSIRVQLDILVCNRRPISCYVFPGAANGDVFELFNIPSLSPWTPKPSGSHAERGIFPSCSLVHRQPWRLTGASF